MLLRMIPNVLSVVEDIIGRLYGEAFFLLFPRVMFKR